MRVGDLDQDLKRLHQASERISASLVELEIDSGRKLLDASPLEGESAARWTAASATLTELWRRNGLLDSVLQHADEARRSPRAVGLEALLHGPSVELASSEVPVVERDLLGNPEVSQKSTPQALLRSMSAAFDEVKTVIKSIGETWDRLIPRLEAARRSLQETLELAETLDESDRRELGSAAEALSRLSAAVTVDPLSVREAELDDLERSIQAIRVDLEGIASLKRSFETRILTAEELLQQLRETVDAGAAAHPELLVKIAVPNTPAAPQSRQALERQLREISLLARRGAWREARRALEDWTARAETLLEEAKRALEANRAPIEARNQFRALLEAYQIKAERLGVLEDSGLSEIHDQARRALYTAPTDLSVAARLVREYQQAINHSSHAREAKR